MKTFTTVSPDKWTWRLVVLTFLASPLLWAHSEGSRGSKKHGIL